VRGLVGTALEYTEKLIGTGRYDAGIEPEVKECIRLYVETWVLPPLRKANEKLNKSR
jgi:hypothetical protein